MKPWPTPDKIVPPGPMVALRERWEQMAHRRGQLVRVLAPDAGIVPGERQAGVAPALSEVVAALPGVRLGGVVLDWPQGESQRWPELGARETYQPVWVSGREAVVVSVDPSSGVAGHVVHVRGDGEVDVVGDDIVAWLTALTSWAEAELADLERELAPQAESEEELEMFLEEALDQDFEEWLGGLA